MLARDLCRLAYVAKDGDAAEHPDRLRLERRGGRDVHVENAPKLNRRKGPHVQSRPAQAALLRLVLLLRRPWATGSGNA